MQIQRPHNSFDGNAIVKNILSLLLMITIVLYCIVLHDALCQQRANVEVSLLLALSDKKIVASQKFFITYKLSFVKWIRIEASELAELVQQTLHTTQMST